MEGTIEMGFEQGHQRDLAAALRLCQKVAKEEYSVADESRAKAVKIAEGLFEQIEATTPPVFDAGKEATDLLSNLRKTLRRDCEEPLIVWRENLARKKRRLKKFTVALFGRTTAGKSTLREAITGGTGSTIGTGSQNTTRRVREYSWQGLRIVDTPGFGSPAGSKLAVTGRQIVEESDCVLLLLTSESVQSEHFEAMRELMVTNKPTVFLLNVRKDLERPVHQRLALKDSAYVYQLDELEGHERRIRRLAEEWLGMTRIEMLPIHAQAAWLSTVAPNPETQTQLYALSRLERVFEHLLADVKKHGPVRRLQTLIDGTVNLLERMSETYRSLAAEVGTVARFYRERTRSLKRQLDQFTRESRNRLDRDCAALFRPLRTQVAEFVEDIENKDLQARWDRQVRRLELLGKVQKIQESVIEELNLLLFDFRKELDFDAKLLIEMEISVPKHFSTLDLRKALRRVSAAGAALSAVAILTGHIGAANFWNPAGAILVTVSIGAWLTSLCFKNRGRKLAKVMAQAKKELEEQIDQKQVELSEQLQAWFEKELETKGINPVLEEMDDICRQLDSLQLALTTATRNIERQIGLLNCRLIMRTAKLTGREIPDESIMRVARRRGRMTKVLLKSSYRGQKKSFEEISSALREQANGVPKTTGLKFLLNALKPATISADSIAISGSQAILKHFPKLPRKLKHAGELNMQLAEEITGLTLLVSQEG